MQRKWRDLMVMGFGRTPFRADWQRLGQVRDRLRDTPHARTTWGRFGQTQSTLADLDELESEPTPGTPLAEHIAFIGTNYSGLDEAFGWPRLALYRDQYTRLPTDTNMRMLDRFRNAETIHAHGVEVPGIIQRMLPSSAPSSQLPIGIVWSGFLANTLLYALVVLFCLLVKDRLIHSRRMRQGHCPKCKYDLRSDFTVGCPECGWRRKVAQTTGV
ncbi:MAG: hypothetical protein AAGA55_04560 [Planctomycetota bacterium]